VCFGGVHVPFSAYPGLVAKVRRWWEFGMGGWGQATQRRTQKPAKREPLFIGKISDNTSIKKQQRGLGGREVIRGGGTGGFRRAMQKKMSVEDTRTSPKHKAEGGEKAPAR